MADVHRERQAPAAGKRFGRAAATLALLWAVGCGGCDSTESVPCRFTVEDDGSRRMTCPDGTSAVFPPPLAASRAGAVAGTASRFGDPRRDGIDVWVALARTEPDLEPVFVHAATDVEGRFRFEGLPPGVHVVSLRSPGYVGVELPVVVDPGEFVLEPVVLRRGVETLPCEATELFPSPRRDAFLALYGEDETVYRRLVYWQPGGEGMVPIAQRVVTQPWAVEYFDADGGLVHALDNPENATGSGGTLIRYEVDRARRLTIAAGVREWKLALDGDALVLLGPERRLRIWNERFAHPDGSGAVQTIADEIDGYLVGARGRLVVFFYGPLMVAWDVAEMTGDTLGHATPVAFSPDGAVLVARREAELVAWDAEGPQAVRLGDGDPASLAFHDSGRRFLFLQQEGNSRRLVHVDLDRGARPERLRDRVLSASYGPGDGGIAWTEPVAGDERELFLAPGPGAAAEPLGRGAGFSELTWSRDGRRLFFVVHDGPTGTYSLEVHEAGLGTHTVAPDVLGAPLLEPGGEGVFFLVPDDVSVALDYWNPVTDEVVRVHGAVEPWYGPLESVAGPGSRLLVSDQDGGWWRWDPAARTSTWVASADPLTPPRFHFLADGGLVFGGSDRQVRLLDPDASEPRLVGGGLPPAGAPHDGLYGGSSDGKRFSFLHGVPAVPAPGANVAGTLVLFDRATGTAIPLDDRVRTAVQGDRFVAYVRDVPGDAEHPQRLFLVTYPVDER